MKTGGLHTSIPGVVHISCSFDSELLNRSIPACVPGREVGAVVRMIACQKESLWVWWVQGETSEDGRSASLFLLLP